MRRKNKFAIPSVYLLRTESPDNNPTTINHKHDREKLSLSTFNLWVSANTITIPSMIVIKL